MRIQKETFGKTDDGRTVDIFTLKNRQIQVKITNYGGIITQIIAPDRDGNSGNICLGFEKLEDYISDDYMKTMPFFGAIVGRYANRIANGTFTIEGQVYELQKNNFEHTLHGGPDGFDKKIWDAKTFESEQCVRLVLSNRSIDGDQGFPGNLDIQVVYELNNNNELRIDYTAITDKKTHVNLTNHTYFNLSACRRDVLGHEVWIDADRFSAVDNHAIPTGESIAVNESCMDFRDYHPIGERINQVQGNGYDHNYQLNNYTGALRKVAEAIDKESGRLLEVLTTEPGLQFYTSNFLDGTLHNGNIQFTKNMGVCFETQHYPDSPNRPEFPSTLLSPNDIYKSGTIYRFSISGQTD